MNTSGTPTRMIWCDECHTDLVNMGFRSPGAPPHRRLTKKLQATLDRDWHWQEPQA